MIYNNANNRRPTAADFMIMEMEREERRRIRELTRKRIELYLQGKYELEEGEVLEEPDEEEDYIIEIVIQQ